MFSINHLRVNVAQGDSNCVPVENTRRVGLCLRCVRKYMLKHVICDVVVVNVEGAQPPETHSSNPKLLSLKDPEKKSGFW